VRTRGKGDFQIDVRSFRCKLRIFRNLWCVRKVKEGWASAGGLIFRILRRHLLWSAPNYKYATKQFLEISRSFSAPTASVPASKRRIRTPHRYANLAKVAGVDMREALTPDAQPHHMLPESEDLWYVFILFLLLRTNLSHYWYLELIAARARRLLLFAFLQYLCKYFFMVACTLDGLLNHINKSVRTDWNSSGCVPRASDMGKQREHRIQALGVRRQISEISLPKSCETTQHILLTPIEDFFWRTLISYPQIKFVRGPGSSRPVYLAQIQSIIDIFWKRWTIKISFAGVRERTTNYSTIR